MHTLTPNNETQAAFAETEPTENQPQNKQVQEVLQFKFPADGIDRPSMSLVATQNLFRMSQLHWHDMLWISLFDGAKGVFADPEDALSRKWTNFALEFQHIFSRRIAITILRQGSTPKHWPKELSLPRFDIFRPTAGGVDSSWIRVDFPKRGLARLIVEKPDLSIICPEHVAGITGRMIEGSGSLNAPDVKTLAYALRIDPGNPFGLINIGRASKEQMLRFFSESERLKVHLNLVDLQSRLTEASERLSGLGAMLMERCSTEKLQLHFPKEKYLTTWKRWAEWTRLLNRGIEVLEPDTIHEDVALHRECHLWFSRSAELYDSSLPLNAKDALRDGCRSALSTLGITTNSSPEDMWSLQSELYPLLSLGHSFNERKFGLRVMWSAMQELAQLKYVSIPSFRKKLHVAVKDHCLRELETVFEQQTNN